MKYWEKHEDGGRIKIQNLSNEKSGKFPDDYRHVPGEIGDSKD